ncbi:serine/threonine protein kinase [Mycolicibacterium iranicum]|uniref:Serine/threonine protein kinase n=1 Tax=Mycolicibacterium iranicum TaxID=912594 RepID=A0A839Q095_MYCIR|nr:hypothetical protein [Mycolicibacterium iranicum]MBB2989640.1 serine/threonine protein kinase [Mycolicibacterium iranicum]
MTKIGQGGQGVVYSAPGFRTKFTDTMVFKEYRPEALQDMNFDALAAMPTLVEESMSYEDAERLISIAAWPCALVEDNGSPIGQVMPAIPDRFTIPLTTAKGTAPANAELQHLLNHKSILAARGIALAEETRYALLREIASDLAFLHQNSICVGDISPKNLLFSLEPVQAYFIDCDTMRVGGISALPQVETPGWEVPQNEELATIYSDSYKLALLALRLLVGDQDVRDPQRLPSMTPRLLTKLIVDTLSSTPSRRPLPMAWTYILGHAIEEAQQRRFDASATEQSDEAPAPAIPVVRSRPKPQSARKAAGTTSATPPPRRIAPPPTNSPMSLTSGSTSVRQDAVVGVAIAVVAILMVIGVVVAIASWSDDSSDNRTARPSSAYEEPTSSRPRQAPTNDSTQDPEEHSDGLNPTRAPQTATPAIRTGPPPRADLYSGPDPTGRNCGSIDLGRYNLSAARGSEATSCYFAESVGNAYVARNPDPRTTTNIAAAGAVDCRDVPTNPPCSGSNFVMRCVMQGTQEWITCRGGNRAVVYIY